MRACRFIGDHIHSFTTLNIFVVGILAQQLITVCQAPFLGVLLSACSHHHLEQQPRLLFCLLAKASKQGPICLICLQLLLLVYPDLSLVQLRAILAYLHAWSKGCPHGLLSLKQLLLALRSVGQVPSTIFKASGHAVCVHLKKYPIDSVARTIFVYLQSDYFIGGVMGLCSVWRH